VAVWRNPPMPRSASSYRNWSPFRRSIASNGTPKTGWVLRPFIIALFNILARMKEKILPSIRPMGSAALSGVPDSTTPLADLLYPPASWPVYHGKWESVQSSPSPAKVHSSAEFYLRFKSTRFQPRGNLLTTTTLSREQRGTRNKDPTFLLGSLPSRRLE